MPWTDITAFTGGQVLTSTVMNQMRVNERIGHIVCTSSTRPASPETGAMIYESDTGRILVYSGTAWVSPASVNAPPAVNYVWNPFSITTGTLVNQTVNAAPSSTPTSQGGWSIASGVITYPEPGIYTSSMYASPLSGSGYFPITIGIQNSGTSTAANIYQSLPAAGWASYSSVTASGVHVVNGDRQFILKVGVTRVSERTTCGELCLEPV